MRTDGFKSLAVRAERTDGTHGLQGLLKCIVESSLTCVFVLLSSDQKGEA